MPAMLYFIGLALLSGSNVNVEDSNPDS